MPISVRLLALLGHKQVFFLGYLFAIMEIVLCCFLSECSGIMSRFRTFNKEAR